MSKVILRFRILTQKLENCIRTKKNIFKIPSAHQKRYNVIETLLNQKYVVKCIWFFIFFEHLKSPTYNKLNQ